MYRLLTLLFISFSLFSCRQAKKYSYTTETLECLDAIMESQSGDNSGKTIEILSKNEQEFKFAADLKATFSDKLAIFKAENAASTGDLKSAKEIIEKRVVERGYSEVLDESLKNLDRAIKVQKYIKNAPSMEIGERSRELAQLKAHTQESYKHINEFNNWVMKETRVIAAEAKHDKEVLIESFNFITDYLSLHNPDLMEVALIQTAAIEKETLVPGITDDTPENTFKILNRLGVKGAIYNSYSNEGKGLKEYESEGITTLQKQLAYTHLLAKAGQITKTLESLQELQNLCEIEEKYRRSILKELFLSKGWNDASLINRDFLDISYLLETVYKANE